MARDDEAQKKEKDPVYKKGQYLAEMYVDEFGEGKIKKGFERISRITGENFKPTEEMKDVYREIEDFQLKRAETGFYDYFCGIWTERQEVEIEKDKTEEVEEGFVLKKAAAELQEKRVKDLSPEEMVFLQDRNKAFMKFHSDWVLANVRADGQKKKVATVA